MRAIEELTGTRPESLAGPPEDARSVKLLLRSLSRAGRMETILISGGRKDKLRAGDILGALTGEAGSLKGTEVGTIEIQDRKTFVAVAQKVATRAVERLSSGRIKGKRFKARLLDGSPRRGSP